MQRPQLFFFTPHLFAPPAESTAVLPQQGEVLDKSTENCLCGLFAKYHYVFLSLETNLLFTTVKGSSWMEINSPDSSNSKQQGNV